MGKLPDVRQITLLSVFMFAIAVEAAASTRPLPPRRVVSLDGMWQVEQARIEPAGRREIIRDDGTSQIELGGMERRPAAFSHTVAVPGLVDMAQPAFQDVGKKSPLRKAFWYRRTFTVAGPVPPVAELKIHKARYGTRVFLNGQLVGEHLPCFTPAYMDVKKHLRGDGQENELVIRVGANRESLPQDMPTGWDFEKYLYIPGIYDSVELILTGTPYIRNVQIAPDVPGKKARIVAELEAAGPGGDAACKVEVVEAKSGKAVFSGTAPRVSPPAGGQAKIDLTIPIDPCRLWSPADPFLYELRLTSGGDAVKARFGMRSFAFDAKTKRAVLNGKPFFMRGTNVCVYRFFEDANRKDLPWRADWVRKLHQQFKSMHWDAIRYCIGFPPEIWYDIADEEGFLIQDEFPIWLLGKAPESPKAEKIIPEYTEWMRERWNHPCVVIWDAQNESFTDQTGKALQAVRHLDLSKRPWENGWSEPQGPGDFVESHPYLFIRMWSQKKPFRLSELAKHSGVPDLNPRQKKLNVPIIINEYCWLWLNRDGSPTCLTDKVYESILGPTSTVDQRRTIHARYVAALTEFWRCHREAAGVLHFCGLGYSRAGDKPRPEGGATSDHFIDLENLVFEPKIAEYVREAFNPAGLMLDFWADEAACGEKREIKAFAINDRYEDWTGSVQLRIMRGSEQVGEASQPCKISALGRTILSFSIAMPAEPGGYTMIASLLRGGDKPVRSLRDFKAVRPK